MSTWPERERPRERLQELGAAALSDAELLALVLGCGSNGVNAMDAARRLLIEAGGLEGMADNELIQICQLPGVGQAKGARVLAALELGIRAVEQKKRRNLSGRFVCSADVHDVFRARLAPLRHEVFIVIGLNSRNKCVKEHVVARGSVNECRVDPAEVFRPLIVAAASQAILVHNHPSGDTTPSPHDVALTRRLVTVGELLGIRIVDHVVIGHSGYASLCDLCLLGDRPPSP